VQDQVGNRQFDFQIDPVWRTKLLKGWDDIDMTRRFAEDITAFTAADAASGPGPACPAKMNCGHPALRPRDT